VWGSLPDWGIRRHVVYLPTGSVVRHRGRGQRKEQAAFLTRARRFVAKNGKPLLFVAQVKSVEEISRTGVDQVSDAFYLTVTRWGITNEEEADAMETSKRLQRCAALLVDKAADSAGASRTWARQVALYEPYHRASSLLHAEGTLDDNAISHSMKAPLRFLLDIGKLSDGSEVEVLQLLSLSGAATDGLDTGIQRHFAGELLTLCRQEQKRLSKPVPYSVIGTVGDSKAITAAVATEGGSVEASCDIATVKAALAIVQKMKPPEGCSPLTVVLKGAGSYTFATSCSKDDSKKANAFLEGAVTRAKHVWADAVAGYPGISPEMDLPIKAECNSKDGTTTVDSADDLQPTLNIGLIGDVANGISTLIRAISGKQTQSHSSELQKHGMTIRLGFANAIILRCLDSSTCGAYSFSPDKDASDNTSESFCNRCGGLAEIAKRVSFIDCPGHAELMATMLSGASAFDAVIFAAAANAPCPSPQAKQHLEALKLSSGLSESGRIAIAQTKAELVAKQAEKNPGGLSAEELLSLHASNAKEALQSTVASDAPFFPVCAPLGLGLEPLAGWLAKIPDRSRSASDMAHRVFNVLRSFDVNRPGTEAEGLVGGVLGGTISGSGAFRPGDQLEVRPGLVLGKKRTSKETDVDDVDEQPFQICPLRARCVEVMTGKNQLPIAFSGGLVALRTTLSPSLCADDRLVGGVVGSKDMPPVWGPTLLLDGLNLVKVDQSIAFSQEHRSFKLKKGDKIKCHSGSASVVAHVVKVSTKRRKVEVQLKAPLCAFTGSNVAIEAEVVSGSGFRLVAYASLFGGTCCLEGAKAPPQQHSDITDEQRGTSINNSGGEEHHRTQFLQDLEEKQISSDGGRIAVPRPLISRDGGAHVVLNFAIIAASLHREPAHIQTFLEREGGLSCALARGGSSLRIQWRRRGDFAALLNKILYRYAAVFVACRECKSARTEFIKAQPKTELLCRECNAHRFIAKM
jgi:translation initiation factor 2 subunit 3